MTWFTDGSGLADLVLIVVAFEAAVLWGYRRTTGRGLGSLAILRLLLPGAFLVLALRAALLDAGWVWIGLWLALGGLAHAVDLAYRLRR